LCKGRIDLFKNGIIVDCKSTSSSASPGKFFYEATRYRYHIQAALYIDGMIAAKLNDGVPWFAFVVVEGYAPYEIAVFDVQDDKDALSYDFLCYGRLKYHMALQRVAHCLKTGIWPGYGDESFDMDLTYAARQELELLGGGLK